MNASPQAAVLRRTRAESMRRRSAGVSAVSLVAGLGLGLGLGLAGCGGGEPADGGASSADAGGPTPVRIAVVPKGTTHEYWRSVEAGAFAAAREASDSGTPVEMVFRGPDREDDREQQIALLENLRSGDFDGLVLAPLDENALVAPVAQFKDAGIPVVVIDSGLAGEPGRDFASFIATDNRAAGRLAGEHVATALDNVGRVLLLRYLEGSESTTQREEGFVDAIAAAGGFELIDPGRYAGATRATAQQAAENLLASVAPGGEMDAFDAVFCPNESSTYGMLLALRDRGLAGKVTFVGFDASPDLVAGLEAGEIDGLVVQNPVRMGRLGVENVLKAIRGEPVDPAIDTGAALILSDEATSAESRRLLSPDLEAIRAGG